MLLGSCVLGARSIVPAKSKEDGRRRSGFVSKTYVAPGSELQRAVDRHLLARSLTECLSPLELARVALHLEVLVAF